MICFYFLCVLVWSTTVLPVQLSPKKALRAAMLKSRFADTILKAQQKTLLEHVWLSLYSWLNKKLFLKCSVVY